MMSPLPCMVCCVVGGDKTWYMLGGGINNGCGAEVDMVWVVFFFEVWNET